MASRQDAAIGLPEDPTYDQIRAEAARLAFEKIQKKIDLQERKQKSQARQLAMDQARQDPIAWAIQEIINVGGLKRSALARDYDKEGKWEEVLTDVERYDFYEDMLLEESKIINSLLAENRPKPAIGLKNVIRKQTGQIKPTDKLVTEYSALTATFKKEAQAARKAFSEGKKDEVERSKEKMRWLVKRRESLKTVRDYFGLTDAEMMEATNRHNPALMDDAEFAQYLKDVQTTAVLLADNRQAKVELIMLIEDKRLRKVDNYRRALALPPITEMTTTQLRDFAKLLEPFENDDVFLTQRELETVDRTDTLKGVRTWREAREAMIREIQERHPAVELKDLASVTVAWSDHFKWDSALREKDPFFELLIHEMTTASLSADMRVHDIETKVFELAGKSEKSRRRSVSERAIPQDPQIMAWLEAAASEKGVIAQQMTPEQIDYAHFMMQYFAEALQYLLSIKAIEKGRENYITHVRKTFFENVRDKGMTAAVREVFDQAQEDMVTFNILDDNTGNILPLEKFFQFQLHRNGGLDPTTNVTRAFMTYVRAFERKKMFDAIIPKLDIYTQSLTPTIYTPRGLEIDASLKKFVNKYINDKKGRHISYDSVIRQGD